MRCRNLEFHVLIRTAPETYALLDHPEVEIKRYYGTAGYRGWKICSHWSYREEYAGNLEEIDKMLLRYRHCDDCGTFCRNTSHPPARCPHCDSRHQEMLRGYAAGKVAAERVDRLWDLATMVRSASSIESAVTQLLVNT